MAKLTVFFKDEIIHSEWFENDIIRIGRHKTNDLVIDNQAVAPAHAVIDIRDNGTSTIAQLNDDFPLLINGEKIKECNLNNNDIITLGRHDVVYNTTDSFDQSLPFETRIDQDTNLLDQEIGLELSKPAANLQVMDGEDIGKMISLKKAMTRIGHIGNGVIVISRRKNGYFVSVLENTGNVTLNNELLNHNTIKLNHHDVLVLNNTSLQFFEN
jgi:hypothetical protein